MTETDVLPDDASAVEDDVETPAIDLELDAIAAAAVDLARAAAEADAPGLVGEHLGVEPDDQRVVVHYFATLDPAYVGWRWAVTVARASRSKIATVDDVVLLPGADAILAPEWVPWSERLRPGDMGAGDLLPTAPDDTRLVPAYFSTDDEADAAVAFEIGLGRERVLSYDGRAETVDRWYAGDPGPRAEVARTAPAFCASCGFYVPLSGGLRSAFGACANAFAPDDGKVVAVDHGCGAHSEAVVPPASPPLPPPLIDDATYDVVEPATPEERAAAVEAAAALAAAEVSAAPNADTVDDAVDDAADEPIPADDTLDGDELEIDAEAAPSPED
ncbi:MAG TPA: DUF3027 domain-containing protein [Mycobacteriales bacterium]|nr:DUF3027 domain-containing protein [Mycobacteriales bacterium]